MPRERAVADYLRQVRPWAEDRSRRMSRGEKHPVYDFLFEYYSFRPAHARLTWRFGDQIEWRMVLIGLTEKAEQRAKHLVAVQYDIRIDWNTRTVNDDRTRQFRVEYYQTKSRRLMAAAWRADPTVVACGTLAS